MKLLNFPIFQFPSLVLRASESVLFGEFSFVRLWLAEPIQPNSSIHHH